jgi:hypothetical protein
MLRTSSSRTSFLFVPDAVLLLLVALTIVILLGVIILVPLGAVGDEVGGVAALEVAHR